MAYAVEMLFDDDTNAIIMEMWQELKNSKISSYMIRSKSKPHITLSIFDSVDLNELNQRVEKFSEITSACPIKFDSIGVFPDDTGVVYLQPVVSPELLNIHRSFNLMTNEFDEFKWTHYLPGNWVPHCSMALNITKEKVLQAVSCLLEKFSPFEAQIQSLAVIRFPPIEHLKMYDLSL
jgi:2'-5' RNA ligase